MTPPVRKTGVTTCQYCRAQVSGLGTHYGRECPAIEGAFGLPRTVVGHPRKAPRPASKRTGYKRMHPRLFAHSILKDKSR